MRGIAQRAAFDASLKTRRDFELGLKGAARGRLRSACQAVRRGDAAAAYMHLGAVYGLCQVMPSYVTAARDLRLRAVRVRAVLEGPQVDPVAELVAAAVERQQATRAVGVRKAERRLGEAFARHQAAQRAGGGTHARST